MSFIPPFVAIALLTHAFTRDRRGEQADSFAFMRSMYDLDGFCVEPTLTLHDELGPGLSIFDL